MSKKEDFVLSHEDILKMCGKTDLLHRSIKEFGYCGFCIHYQNEQVLGEYVFGDWITQVYGEYSKHGCKVQPELIFSCPYFERKADEE